MVKVRKSHSLTEAEKSEVLRGLLACRSALITVRARIVHRSMSYKEAGYLLDQLGEFAQLLQIHNEWREHTQP